MSRSVPTIIKGEPTVSAAVRTVEDAEAKLLEELSDAGLKATVVFHNLTPAELYEKVRTPGGRITKPFDGRITKVLCGRIAKPFDGRITRLLCGRIAKPFDGRITRLLCGRIAKPGGGRITKPVV